MEMIKTNAFCELTDDEMQTTDGGAWWEVAVAIWVLYEVGYAVGKAIAHARG